ncbi:FKBP-type peptidyl-prolyl cis-trans isomerase [Breznakiellaceae bacterium SP9]
MNITKDRFVSFSYTLTDADKQVLDSANEAEPLVYLHGFGDIIPGLERALEGRNEGDSFVVTIPAADAYGQRDEDLVAEVPIKKFEGEDIEVGMEFHARIEDGYHAFIITRIEGDTVTVDGNPPFAGKDLTFDITILNVRQASAEELAHGHRHGEDGCDDCGDCDGCHRGDDCGCGCD